MFVIKKLVAPFALPPGIFVLLLFILAARCAMRKRASAALGALAIGLLLWIGATVPTAVLLTRGLETRYPLPDPIDGDVIILLGGGYFDRAVDLTGTGFPAGDMAGRLITAARLQGRLRLPLILSSGQVSRHTQAGARIDQRILTDLGVPANQINVETASRDTAENAFYSQKICQREGYRRPILITSALHLPRAVRLFRAAGLDVLPVPAYRRTWEDQAFYWRSWLPSATALETTSDALHEYLGLTYYWLLALVGGL
jgi:uncharacterized SAM-binding protein YcdF (DUF218 family)